MRKWMRSVGVWAVAFGGSLLAGASARGAVLYSQTFNYPSGTGSTSTISYNAAFGTNSSNELSNGWAVYETPTATDQSGNAGGTGAAISDRQSPNSTSTDFGFALFNAGAVNPIGASTPTGLSINPTTQGPLSISFYQGDANATDFVRIALLVGGQWYATTQTFSTAAQGAATFGANPSSGSLQSFTYTPTAASWDLLNFTPGSTLTLGSSPSSNLSGNITGVGLFSEQTLAGNVRFDTFQIASATPEPTSLGLLGLVGVGLLGRRRRGV